MILPHAPTRNDRALALNRGLGRFLAAHYEEHCASGQERQGRLRHIRSNAIDTLIVSILSRSDGVERRMKDHTRKQAASTYEKDAIQNHTSCKVLNGKKKENRYGESALIEEGDIS